jgi:hypothetical protein
MHFSKSVLVAALAASAAARPNPPVGNGPGGKPVPSSSTQDPTEASQFPRSSKDSTNFGASVSDHAKVVTADADHSFLGNAPEMTSQPSLTSAASSDYRQIRAVNPAQVTSQTTTGPFDSWWSRIWHHRHSSTLSHSKATATQQGYYSGSNGGYSEGPEGYHGGHSEGLKGYERERKGHQEVEDGLRDIQKGWDEIIEGQREEYEGYKEEQE